MKDCALLKRTRRLYPPDLLPPRGVDLSDHPQALGRGAAFQLMDYHPAVLLDIEDLLSIESPVVGLLPASPRVKGRLVERYVAPRVSLEHTRLELELLAVLVV